MAYITSFVYCQEVNEIFTPQGKQIQIVNPLQVITPEFLPTYFTFSIACSILDVGGSNTFRIIFKSPNGTTLTATEDVVLDIPNNTIEGIPSSLQINMELRNVIFKNAGTYVTEVQMNGNTLGTYEIAVIKGVSK